MKDKTLTLSPREATDRAIASAIFRHIANKGMSKIEVRYSTHTPAVSHRGIQSQLHSLAKRQPLPKIDFSCRPHDNPLDDATGETHIRLIYSTSAGSGQIVGPLIWFQRLFSRTGSAATTPAVNQDQDVVTEIKAALKHAANARAKRFQKHPIPDVAHVTLVVREARIDKLLSAMKDPIDLAIWFRRQIQALDHPVSPRLTASYEFRPYRAAEGTDLLGGCDLEIDLLEIAPESITQHVRTTITPPATPRAQTKQGTPPPLSASSLSHPIPAPTNTQHPKVISDFGTLPPDWTESSPYILTIQIESPKPPAGKGEIQLDHLPVRMDRNLLLKCGLAEYFPVAAHVASNQTPLEIDATPAGRLRLNARPRKEFGLPMYYLADGEPRGIVRPIDLATAEARIVINSPQGVTHPVHGHIDPIVLRLTVAPAPTFLPPRGAQQ